MSLVSLTALSLPVITYNPNSRNWKDLRSDSTSSEVEARLSLASRQDTLVHGFSLWAHRLNRRGHHFGSSNSPTWTWRAFGLPVQALPEEDQALLLTLARTLSYVYAELGETGVTSTSRRASVHTVGKREIVQWLALQYRTTQV